MFDQLLQVLFHQLVFGVDQQTRQALLAVAQLLCAVAWSVFADEKSKTILPFVLDWDSKDDGTDYVKNWEAELNCWYGTKAFKKLGAAIVMVDGKLCLAVFYMHYDDDNEVY